MVIEIDTAHDTPEEMSEKIRQACEQMLSDNIAAQRALKLSAFGQVQWEEDALEYQKKMRDEWS